LNYELNDYIHQLIIIQNLYVDIFTNSKKKQHFALHGKVVTYQLKEDTDENFSHMIKQLSLQKLTEESKKITSNNMHLKKIIFDEALVNDYLALLPDREQIKPRNANESFFNFDKDKAISLIRQSKVLIEQTKMVLQVKYPIKIFGSLHGQYNDLMRYFNIFGRPSEFKGDIESFEYLFLGNLWSKGSHGLEVLFLILALKVSHF
jgi:hypothetical protein